MAKFRSRRLQARITSAVVSEPNGSKHRPLDGRDGFRCELRSAGSAEATPALERWRSKCRSAENGSLLKGNVRGLGANAGVDVPGDHVLRSKRTRTTANARFAIWRLRAMLGRFLNVRYNAGGNDRCGELPSERERTRNGLGRIAAQTRANRTRANSDYAHARDISGIRTHAVYCGNCNRCGCAIPV